MIRHPQAGAPAIVTRHTDAHVVNAGDGKHQHPTQSLLDLYTIRERAGPGRGAARSRSSATCCTRGWPAPTSRRCRMLGRARHPGRAAAADPARSGRDGRDRLARHRRHRRGRRRLRPAHAARAHAGGRELRALAARVQRALGGDPGPGAAQPAGDAPGADQPRRRDLGRGGRQRQLADRRPGAGRPGDADGGALRPAHRAAPPAAARPPCGPSSRPGRRWRDADG